MNYKQLLIGFATYLPGVYQHFAGTGGTVSARYCYAVWLRHLVMAHRSGLVTNLPDAVGELGPGDSLGTGLAALISGANTYYAFDVVRFANTQRNLEIFDELVELFRRCEDIPTSDEFPRIAPDIDSYRFPSNILSHDHLEKSLEPGRLQRIRRSLENLNLNNDSGASIRYVVPWTEPGALAAKDSSVDMIYSQAVLEHVDNLEFTYKTLHRWLKPDGFMSHQIDFTCHQLDNRWNGHWTYSDFTWKLVRGNRPWFLNRQPYSTHTTLLRKWGFKIVNEVLLKDTSGITRDQLAAEFNGLSDDDVITRAAFVQAVKR